MASEGSSRARVLLGGGIGAGKSTVAAAFEEAGFEVIEADEIGRGILAPGTRETAAVQELWPDVVDGGVVDRKALAAVVFDAPRELDRLEAITHPGIATEIERRVAAGDTDIVVEAPLMSITLSGEWTRVAVVADTRTRMARAVARGGDPRDVRRRMAAQASTEDWVDWADVVIDNGGAWIETEKTVTAIIEAMRQ